MSDLYLPVAEVPLSISEYVALGSVGSLKDTLTLLLLVPMLGVADILLLNSLRLPILWTTLSLACLAIFETAAIVTLVSGRTVTK